MITIHVTYNDEEIPPGMNEQRVRSICETAGSLIDLNGEIDISFIPKETMRELNRTYRGKDDSTDILSFATYDTEDDFPAIETDSYLGELIISPSDVLDNCSYFSVDPDNEFIRILVHGMLHLTGYDHETNDDDEPMLQQQERLVELIAKELDR
ncbi:MAG: rRNA maturation RNase YbeY [Sphaerochaetaceae bacterium]|nr:rRNA maturation RNase YbeY [Sphaerochaetaceae bacterium]